MYVQLSLNLTFVFVEFRALDFAIFNISAVCFKFCLSPVSGFELTVLVMLLNCCSSAFKKEDDAWERMDVCTHSCMLRCMYVSLLSSHGFGSKGTGRELI